MPSLFQINQRLVNYYYGLGFTTIQKHLEIGLLSGNVYPF